MLLRHVKHLVVFFVRDGEHEREREITLFYFTLSRALVFLIEFQKHCKAQHISAACFSPSVCLGPIRKAITRMHAAARTREER